MTNCAYIAVFLAVFLAGCGSQPVRQPGRVVVDLEILQVPARQIHDYCPAGLACYHHRLNRIVVQEIRGDHDSARLRDLGEEVWHAIGGRH